MVHRPEIKVPAVPDFLIAYRDLIKAAAQKQMQTYFDCEANYSLHLKLVLDPLLDRLAWDILSDQLETDEQIALPFLQDPLWDVGLQVWLGELRNEILAAARPDAIADLRPVFNAMRMYPESRVAGDHWTWRLEAVTQPNHHTGWSTSPSEDQAIIDATKRAGCELVSITRERGR